MEEKRRYENNDHGGNYFCGWDTVIDVVLESNDGTTIVKESGYCYSPFHDAIYNEWEKPEKEYNKPIEEVVDLLGLRGDYWVRLS